MRRRRITPTHHDWEDYTEYRAQRSVNEATESSHATWLAVLCILAAGFCAFRFPENFIGIVNFNGKCAIGCIVLAFIFMLIARASGLHIDPSDRYVNKRHDNRH